MHSPQWCGVIFACVCVCCVCEKVSTCFLYQSCLALWQTARKMRGAIHESSSLAWRNLLYAVVVFGAPEISSVRPRADGWRAFTLMQFACVFLVVAVCAVSLGQEFVLACMEIGQPPRLQWIREYQSSDVRMVCVLSSWWACAFLCTFYRICPVYS